jgi:hypothetical protein
MTADKLARMSMAASIGPGLSEADYGLFSRSLEDMSGCIHQLCRAYQLQEPALVPGGAFPDQTSGTSEAATAPAAATGEDSEAGRGFKKHRPSNRVRPDKACLECGRRDTGALRLSWSHTEAIAHPSTPFVLSSAQWRRGPLGVSTYDDPNPNPRVSAMPQRSYACVCVCVQFVQCVRHQARQGDEEGDEAAGAQAWIVARLHSSSP